MSLVLPPPVPLPQPPGSVTTLGGVLDGLATAGFATGLTSHLLEPAAVLSGWQGADATVAAAEIGTALGVAADLHEALSAATARLSDHHELWLAVRARVSELRAEQRARFTDAGVRLAVLLSPGSDVGPPFEPAGARALIDAVTAQDARAAADHRALLQALTDDARSIAALLAAATRPLGGTGRPGDAAAVTARLAIQLPGWGEGALATLGRQAADELTGSRDSGDLAGAVERWRGFATLPGFADALVGRLGPERVTWLLSLLAGLAGTGEEEPLSQLLGAALGGPGAGPAGHRAEVLAAIRLDRDDPDGAVDQLAVGMGLVLTAPGIGASLATAWGRQLLDRERAQGARAGVGGTGGALLADPVDAALAALARAGDRAAAAQLLADPGAWSTLLSRAWPHGTDSLAAVIGLAAAAPEAGRVAGSVLVALGQGLTPGDSARVLDDREGLAAVRTEVTALVAGQPEVVLPVLRAAVPDAGPDAGGAALRGLGHLVADSTSAEVVTAAVRSALQAGAAGAVAGAVAGAHVAVLEYGQRLHYALEWSRAQSRAVDAQILWTLAIRLPISLAPRGGSEIGGAIADVVADPLNVNGDVEIGPDRGVVRTAEDAAEFARNALGAAAAPAARDGFQRAGELLGRLEAPQESFLDQLDDAPIPDLSRRSRHGR